MRTISLLDTLMPSTRQNILAATVLHPDKSWYLRELAEFLSVSPSSLQRELTNLTEAGVLKKTIDGNRTYFNADQNCPIFPELKNILIKTVGIVDLLQQALKPLSKNISVAFVFGSIVTGTESSESDVDLFIVGDVKLMEVLTVTKNAEHKLRRSINPIILSATEAKRKLKDNNAFIKRVCQSDKLFLIRKDNELGKTFS